MMYQSELEVGQVMAPPGHAPASRPASARKMTLLVVDEQPVVQLGIRLFASSCEYLCEVLEARSGGEAIATARRTRPSLVLLDPSLSDILLSESVARLRAVSPSTRIIIFAAHLTPTIREQAILLEVHGLLGKDTTQTSFVDVVGRVLAGETLVDPGRCDDLQAAAIKLNSTPLTAREHEIIRRAAHGESNIEIASAIYLAPTTVKSYIQSALRKLNARNRAEAVLKLSELRLL